MRRLIYERELRLKLVTRIIATACTADLAAVLGTTSSAPADGKHVPFIS
ncbi:MULTISPECIES: hypothetical protein [unclassified Streptomyces]|nr:MULTISPECIES: hypothetical protein [unclassified Streptomyces]